MRARSLWLVADILLSFVLSPQAYLGGEAVVDVDVVEKVVPQERVHLANAVVQLRRLLGIHKKQRRGRAGSVCNLAKTLMINRGFARSRENSHEGKRGSRIRKAG